MDLQKLENLYELLEHKRLTFVEMDEEWGDEIDPDELTATYQVTSGASPADNLACDDEDYPVPLCYHDAKFYVALVNSFPELIRLARSAQSTQGQ